MTKENEIRKLDEMMNDYKSGKLKLNGCEFFALSEYLNSLENKK